MQTTHQNSLYLTGIDETMRAFVWKDDGQLWRAIGELEFWAKPAIWEITNTV
jgi:hypothetical protein